MAEIIEQTSTRNFFVRLNLARTSPRQLLGVALIFMLALVAYPVLWQTSTSGSPLVPANTGNAFSVIQITDTQYLSSMYPALYMNTVKWIVNNRHTYNIQMVIHTGDIVDDCHKAQQWANANAAMIQLYENGIPYSWDAGNHDQGSSNLDCVNADGSWIGVNYPAFNAVGMRSKSYWVGDIFDGQNTATKFSYGGRDFLIVNIEWLANATVIDWMRNLIASHPNYNVIVATHGYIGILGQLEPWSSALRETLNSLPNVVLTMSGHYVNPLNPHGVHEKIGNREETMFNQQFLDYAQGAAAVRIFTFNTTTSSVMVSTYSIYSNSWLTDPNDSYSFEITH
jgi:hypothetical protein